MDLSELGRASRERRREGELRVRGRFEKPLFLVERGELDLHAARRELAVELEARAARLAARLSGGIELLSVVIGLFGLTEVFFNVERELKTTLAAGRIRGLWPSLADWRASWRAMLRGSGLGFLLGLVPGGGPVELRATGLQTVAPGSTHPTGEAVRWDADGEPAAIAPDELVAALEALVIAVRHELGDTARTPRTPAPPGTARRCAGRSADTSTRR